MSHSEEISLRPIRKPIKDIGKCTRSNKIHGNFGQISEEQNLWRSSRPLLHVGNIGIDLTYYSTRFH